MQIDDIPALNAVFNSLSSFCLIVGYFFIRRKEINKHRFMMVSALVFSALFLTGYLIYHYHAGSTKFQGEGLIRPVYFTILISHTILAVVIVPLVLVTVIRAFKGRFEKHKAIARWTLPLWLYVSVTGVLIYLMLYRWFPSS